MDSGLHPFDGKSGAPELPHVKGTFIYSGPCRDLKRGDTGCPSRSPINPSIELGRSVISVTGGYSTKVISKPQI